MNDDGSYTVSATSNSTNGNVAGNHGNLDYWIFKIDSTGNIIWGNSYGGTSSDFAGKLMPTPDKGIIVAGFTNSSDGDVAGNYGFADCWVIKLHAEVQLAKASPFRKPAVIASPLFPPRSPIFSAPLRWV